MEKITLKLRKNYTEEQREVFNYLDRNEKQFILDCEWIEVFNHWIWNINWVDKIIASRTEKWWRVQIMKSFFEL